MASRKALVTECTPYRISFCEKEKRIINKIKAEYLGRTGAQISIETAVKILIRRNK
jgi:hypothetical protein